MITGYNSSMYMYKVYSVWIIMLHVHVIIMLNSIHFSDKVLEHVDVHVHPNKKIL